MFVVLDGHKEITCFFESKEEADKMADHLGGSAVEVREGEGRFFWWEGRGSDSVPICSTWRVCRAFNDYPGEKYTCETDVHGKMRLQRAVAFTDERVREILRNGGL